MSIYYRDSGLTWKQYLQADSFVQDITGGIERSGEGIKTAISDQTRNIIASNDALAMEFGVGFDKVNSTLDWGFGRVVSEISELRAEFSYGMGLVLEQLRIQQRTLESILDRLDAIHETLKHPLLTQARELSKIGMERMQRGLLEEGLEALLESAEKNRTDFLVQLQIGKLYLYGQNLTDDVIDLPSAEKCLRLATRYANSEIQSLPDAAKFCGEAFLHAAISCYAQANEKWLAKDADAARNFTEQALELSQNATQVYPELAEAFYHHAKFAALLDDGETAQNSLKTAIIADRNYCIKADADRDFDGVREYVHNLFESLRQQAKQKATPVFESMKKVIEDWNFQCPEAKQAEPEIRKLYQKAESLYRRDTYFDYLGALPLLEKIQQIFDPIPQKEKLYQQAKEEATTAFESVKKLLEDWIFQGTAKQAESEIRDLFQRAETLYRKDTYSDYLDALSLLKDTQEIFDQIPLFVEFTTLTEYSDWVYSVAFSPDSRYLASGSLDKTVKIYQTEEFEWIATRERYLGGITSVAFSPDGRYLAGAEDKTVKIYQTEKFKDITTLTGHSDWVYSVVFSFDGKYLASASEDKTVRVYQTDGFKEIMKLKRHSNSVTSVAFSYDSRYLVSGSRDKTIKIYQVDDGFREIMTLTGHSNRVTSVAFSPDGRYLASGSYDNTVKIYQVDDGFREIMTLTGHSNRVTSIAFSFDGKYLASGSYDETIKIYQVDDGFKEIMTLTGHSNHVYSVAFSPDGMYIASGSEDRTVKIWVRGVISRQEFEEQEKRRIKAEKESECRRKEQELSEYRLKNKLCLTCGEKLGFMDKLSGTQYCKRHR